MVFRVLVRDFLQKKWALVRAGVLLCLLGFLRVVLEKVVVCGWFFVVKTWWSAW
jgi:hypothetical protein